MTGLLALEQVAPLLNKAVSTLYRYMDDPRDPMPYIQLEGGRLIDAADLEAYLERRKCGKTVVPVVRRPRRLA